MRYRMMRESIGGSPASDIDGGTVNIADLAIITFILQWPLT